MIESVRTLLNNKKIKFTEEKADNGTTLKSDNFELLINTNLIVKTEDRTVIVFGSDQEYLVTLKSLIGLE